MLGWFGLYLDERNYSNFNNVMFNNVFFFYGNVKVRNMYIILLETTLGEKEIINIFVGQDITFVNKWINKYLVTEAESLCYAPCPKGMKKVSYRVQNNSLIRCFKKVNKGYVYNTSEKSEEVVYNVHYLEFESKPTNEDDIHTINEINDRVLKLLDKDSLYKVICEVQERLQLRGTINNAEYVDLYSKVMKDFKKELYSSIIRKVKKTGKKS